jgi:ribonucleotide reductase beta subunit family protein with ferritin-like domain
MNKEIEPLFNEKRRRFNLLPIEYPEIWNLYKQQQASFWRVEELDFSKDYEDFKTLNEDEKTVIKMVLAFFSGLDGLVNFNIQQNLINNFVPLEIQMCYGIQVAMENIHNETYAIMLTTLVKDETELNHLFKSLESIPSIKKMKKFGEKYMKKRVPTYQKVVAFACIEGIMFSGAFAVIFWLKNYKQGKGFMTGLMMSNEFISRDEGLHVRFAEMLYEMIKFKDETQTIKIIGEAVKIATDFMMDAIKTKLIGLSNESMEQYIKYVADRLIIGLGYKKRFFKENPYSFMNTIGMSSKTNFHDRRVAEYQMADLSNADDLKILDPDDF